MTFPWAPWLGVTTSTSMLYENGHRHQLQILAKYSGSCSHAAQQNVIMHKIYYRYRLRLRHNWPDPISTNQNLNKYGKGVFSPAIVSPATPQIVLSNNCNHFIPLKIFLVIDNKIRYRYYPRQNLVLNIWTPI